MRSAQGIFATNLVTRNRILVSTEVLESGLEQTWEVGNPMFMSHDMHRPLAWSKGVGLLLCPALTALIGRVYFPEHEDEYKWMENAIQAYLNRKLTGVTSQEKSQLLSLIGSAAQPDVAVYRLETVCAVENGLAERLRPALFKTADHDGLVLVNDLRQIAPGVFDSDGILLFASQNYRRSQSRFNNLNEDFLSILGRTGSDANLCVKIRLDSDMVGLPGTWKQPIEQAYWWGPKFTDTLSENQGVTQQEGNKKLKLFHGIVRTEFWWHNQDETKTLEAEEVLDNASMGISSDHYACRYVHSMLRKGSNEPIHLDGAVRIYDTEAMAVRQSVQIADAGRKTDYQKLWRIDGPLKIDLWKELICHFYKDNPLVGEYFGGVDTVLLESPTDPLEMKKTCLPRIVEAGEGMIILVAYEECEAEVGRSDIEVRPNTSWKTGESDLPCIEFSAIDLLKLLKVEHGHVSIPSDLSYVAFEDTPVNLPPILHYGEHAVANAEKSRKCLESFAEQLMVTGDVRFLTAAIGVEINDRVVLYSFAGSVKDLSCSLREIPSLPDSLDKVGKWCALAQSTIASQHPGAKFDHSHLELVDGKILKLKRKTIDLFPGEAGKFNAVIPKSDTEIAEAIVNQEVGVAPYHWVQQSRCGKCQADYPSCPCTIFLSGDSRVSITSSVRVGGVLTSRSSTGASE